jgi:sigma-B regulation protein RsbU (phosphoserine phosphatase)
MQQAIVLRDLPEDTKITIYPGFGKAMPKSVIYLPQILRGEAMGVIMLASLVSYDSYLVETLETFAATVSIALGNAISHTEIRELAQELEAKNLRLDAQNEELQAQNEEICAQSEEIQAQNAELQAQNLELAQKGEDIERHARELEERTQDVMALQSIVTIALSSVKLDDLLRGMLEKVTELTGAEFGLIALLDDSREYMVPIATHNLYTAEISPLSASYGLVGDVSFSGSIMYSSDCASVLGEQEASYHPECAIVGIPLKVGNRFYGVALLGFPGSREVSKREYNLLNIFSSRCAIAVERAQAYEQMEQAEKRAMEDRERLQAIIDNLPQAVIIANGPDGSVYMANKVALQLCGIDIIPATVFRNHPNAFNVCMTNGDPVDWTELPLYRSYNYGETRTGDELLVTHPDGQQVTILVNSVPMRDSDGTIIGAIAVFQDVTDIKAHQKLLVEGYEQQRTIAETLQKTFLPNIKPVLSTYDIADIYVPAHTHAQVGGDLYDLIALDEHRIGLVIADVSGKGVEAAVHTAMAKYMLRAFVHENPNPGSVIKRLNDAMVRYVGGEVFVTLFYGVLDTVKRDLRYVNAGHELPLIYNTLSNNSTLLKTTGPATGILPDAHYKEENFHLEENDAILLYTDGVTESRQNGVYFGIEGLSKTIAGIKGLEAADVAERLLNEARDFSGGTFHDDVAIVVIRPVSAAKEELPAM